MSHDHSHGHEAPSRPPPLARWRAWTRGARADAGGDAVEVLFLWLFFLIRQALVDGNDVFTVLYDCVAAPAASAAVRRVALVFTGRLALVFLPGLVTLEAGGLERPWAWRTSSACSSSSTSGCRGSSGCTVKPPATTACLHVAAAVTPWRQNSVAYWLLPKSVVWVAAGAEDCSPMHDVG